MNVSLEAYAHVKVDNISVVTNLLIPELMLKKSKFIAYYFVLIKYVADIIEIGCENTKCKFIEYTGKKHSLATKSWFAKKFYVLRLLQVPGVFGVYHTNGKYSSCCSLGTDFLPKWRYTQQFI